MHVNKAAAPPPSLALYFVLCFCLFVFDSLPSYLLRNISSCSLNASHPTSPKCAFTARFVLFVLSLLPPTSAAAARAVEKTSAVSITSPDKFIFLPPHLSLPLCLRQSLHLAHSPYFFFPTPLFFLFLAASLPHTHFASLVSQNSGNKDCDVQYAELDTAALASSPSPRSSAHTGPGDLVEYATIQPSSH